MYKILLIDTSKPTDEVMDMFASAFEAACDDAYDKGFDDGVKEAEMEAMREYIEELEDTIKELEEVIEEMEDDLDVDEVIIDTLMEIAVEKAYKEVYGLPAPETDDLELIEDNGCDTCQLPAPPQFETTLGGFTLKNILDLVKQVEEISKLPVQVIPLEMLHPSLSGLLN